MAFKKRTDQDPPRPNTTLDLSQAGLRMRRPAIVAAATLLLLCLLLPLSLRYLPDEPFRPAGVPNDAFWLAGSVSAGHRQFGTQCELCHQAPFQPVDNAACRDCHSAMPDHAASSAAPLAHTVAARDCSDCHREHSGAPHLLAASDQLCTHCHAPGRQLDGMLSPTAGSFGSDHPEFRPQGQTEVAGQHATGLRFNHAIHLDAAGVKGPAGTETLACADCHRPSAGEVSFDWIDYARDCQRCHALEIDSPDGTILPLPHGDSTAVRVFVARMLAAPAARDSLPAPQRQRPGASAERGAPPDPVSEVFRFRVCAKCHEIDETNTGPAVTTINWPRDFFAHARFDHDPHSTVECTSCHAAEHSDAAEDLLLPTLTTCRECHGDSNARQIDTACGQCHRYHGTADPADG